jgi:hypothetical protein
LETIYSAFDFGFDTIKPFNIRLLKGSKYETDEFRSKYSVKGKFRPYFGDHGIYSGKPVFEIDEEVRSTKDMSEVELNNYKVHHWLIYFCWSENYFKPILQFAMEHGINPAEIINSVAHSKQPVLADLFDSFKKESMGEWFDSKQEVLEYFSNMDNFEYLKNEFLTINYKLAAEFILNIEYIDILRMEIKKHIKLCFVRDNAQEQTFIVLDQVEEITQCIMCRDLLLGSSSEIVHRPWSAIKYFTTDKVHNENNYVKCEIFRSSKDIEFCERNLVRDGCIDISKRNVTNFVVLGGLSHINKRVRVIREC